MKPKIIDRPIKRFFAFGCSFTAYNWPMWPDIVAYDIGVPWYNYGRSGAGNYYIFNSLMRADNAHRLNENDLVMICWTNVVREDRYKDGIWYTPGNIYTQQEYDEKYVKEWADPYSYAMRDFGLIKATYELLEKRKVQFHFMKMCSLDMANQWDSKDTITVINELKHEYDFYLSKINSSFYEVLWNNDIQNKIRLEKSLYGGNFIDGHPTPKESLIYLEKSFDHNFSTSTNDVVEKSDMILHQVILDFVQKKVDFSDPKIREYLYNTIRL